MEKIKLGIIGAGVIGRHHAEVASKLGEYQLVAVADAVEEKARELASLYGVRAYRSFEELLDREELDVISICTPHPTHYEVAIEALKRGIHVLTEKPMAATVSQCLSMITEARKRGVKLGVVFQYRFEPRLRRAKSLIASGALGELYRGYMRYVTYRDMAYFYSAQWRGKWVSEGGGVLINQGVHFIDIFIWLMGRMPFEVFAYGGTVGHDIEVEDLISAVAVYENECQAMLQLSTLDYPDMFNVEIRGDRGMLLVETSPKPGELGLMNLQSVYAYRNEPPIRKAIYASIKPGAPKLVFSIEEIKAEESFMGHEAVYRDFARALIEGREPEVPGEEGLKSVELVNAIIMSAVEHKPVRIPLNPIEYDKLLDRLIKSRSPPWPQLVRKIE
ncbi:MAG: Gfo/Idh/MocA family oxidoreductase [Thermofilaceae archaeon]